MDWLARPARFLVIKHLAIRAYHYVLLLIGLFCDRSGREDGGFTYLMACGEVNRRTNSWLVPGIIMIFLFFGGCSLIHFFQTPLAS